MPIQKRKNKVFAEPVESDGKLHIVARPKKPMPENPGIINTMHDAPSAATIRAMGPLAIDCNELPDQRFNINDQVTCMRTPYDKKNPQEQRYRNRVRNRGTAITAFCITCVGGRKAVTECIATTCPLWAFRFGSDPFYGNRK